MKRSVWLVLVLAFALIVAACGGDDEADTEHDAADHGRERHDEREGQGDPARLAQGLPQGAGGDLGADRCQQGVPYRRRSGSSREFPIQRGRASSH